MIRLIISLAALALVACNSKTEVQNIVVDGDTVTTKSTTIDDTTLANYQLAELNPGLEKYKQQKLKEAGELIKKYHGSFSANNYDCKILDEVFEKWRKNSNGDKEDPSLVVEAMGFAMGQDIVNSLNCEWKIITDQYGENITVIHKKFVVNGYPMSSAEKAYEEGRTGSFHEIKLVLKHNIAEAEKNGLIRPR